MTKWTEERTNQLNTMAGSKDETVSRETVEQIAQEMEISNRSASSKLRKEGYTVETVGSKPKNFTEEQTEQLRDILESNSGEFTYSQLAEQLGTDHTARSVQGKVLSMEMTGHVAPTPVKETEKTYTDEESQMVVDMTNDGAFLEEIAEAVGKPINSVRGKALSLLRAEQIEALPAQRDKKEAKQDVFDTLGAERIAEMTVEELVEESGKTARGVKTILTRRELTAKDYDGAKKAAKSTNS